MFYLRNCNRSRVVQAGVSFEATVTACGAQTKYKKCSLHDAPVDSVG